ncbi:MAG: hypothetical protein VKL39_09355, partial [Leptolyngbyaceae bacterium]|nr:hypothetical protein [Leptolyngbyaceae bacterium]
SSTPSNQFQENRFLRFSDQEFSEQENVNTSGPNGNNLSVTNAPRVTTGELLENSSEDSSSQAIDEDSLADFCKRFKS